jgi:hypothetical protein
MSDAGKVGSAGIAIPALVFFAPKSIVTAANYGKPRGDGSAATLRSTGGTAMRGTIRHLAVFVLDIQIELARLSNLKFAGAT